MRLTARQRDGVASRSRPERVRQRARTLVLLACAVALLDSMLISALPPLLPTYAARHGLSSSAAGVLSASYSVGLLLAAIPAGMLVAQLGPRRVVGLALLVLASSSVLFGLAGSVEGLIAARTVEGAASAFSWTGMFAWLTAATPRATWARAFGTVFGAAFLGFTAGPVLGALGAGTSTALAFGAFGIAAACLALATTCMPGTARPPSRPLAAYTSLVRRPGVPYALWLQTLPGLLAGATALVAALMLADTGSSTAAIAGVFVAGSALQVASSPLGGRWAANKGPLRPIRASLLGSAALVVCIAPAQDTALLGPLVALSFAAFALMLAPATTLLTAAVENADEDPTLGFALMNVAFAPGALVGSVGAGILRDTLGDGAALGSVAALCLLTALIPRTTALPPTDEPRHRDDNPTGVFRR